MSHADVLKSNGIGWGKRKIALLGGSPSVADAASTSRYAQRVWMRRNATAVLGPLGETCSKRRGPAHAQTVYNLGKMNMAQRDIIMLESAVPASPPNKVMHAAEPNRLSSRNAEVSKRFFVISVTTAAM